MTFLPSFSQIVVSSLFGLLTSLAAVLQIPTVSPAISFPSPTPVHIQSPVPSGEIVQNNATIKNHTTKKLPSYLPNSPIIADRTPGDPEDFSLTPTDTQSESTQPTSTMTQSTPPSVSTPPVVTHKTITAHSTIKDNGKTINLTMYYPNTGGAITGSIGGDCDGTISGQYAGPSTDNLSGTAKASCSEGFISVPVTLSYTGKMLPSDTAAKITYTVTALGEAETQTSILNLDQ